MWRSLKWFGLLAGLCAIPLAVLVGQQEAANNAAKGVRIGVVDVGRVFEGYAKGVDLEAQMMADWEALKKKQESLKKQVSDLRGLLELSAESSEQRSNRELQLQQAQLELEHFTQSEGKKIVAKHGELKVELYNEVARAVRELGQAEGYALILKYDSGDLASSSPISADIKMTARSVLYHAGEVDITQRILDALNQRYAEQKQEK